MPVVRAGSAGTRTNKKAAYLKRCFFIWDFKAAEKDSQSVLKRTIDTCRRSIRFALRSSSNRGRYLTA